MSEIREHQIQWDRLRCQTKQLWFCSVLGPSISYCTHTRDISRPL